MHILKSTLILLITTFCFNISSYSQNLVQGKIIDSKTKRALAFVNIIFNDNPYFGTTTDIDGKFSFNSAVSTEKLTCSYVGYDKLEIDLSKQTNLSEILIELNPSQQVLNEVLVRASENPANRIIRQVTKNKDLNNPENISSFKYTSYNKNTYNFIVNDSLKSKDLKHHMDSSLKGGHLFFSESVSERKFIKPDISEEVVLATKVSGFKNPSFSTISEDIQPFSFYKDYITILDINYLNPISKGSLKKYAFMIEDTLLQKLDTTFIISFKPRSKKNIEGLKGLLYINTNKYAIQNVIAEPYETGLIDIKIQQKYSLIDNEQWFPQQLNFELIIKNYPSKDMGMSINGKNYIEKVELNPELKQSDFKIETLSIHKLANDRDSLYWIDHRSEALNSSEKITYRVIDSLGKKYKFDKFLNVFEKLGQQRIPIKFLDLDISKSLIYNQHEGSRLGLGFYTNEKLFKNISLGAFAGCGLKDEEWKYGAEFILSLNRDKEFEIKVISENNLKEIGQSNLNVFDKNKINFRDFLASKMDRIQHNGLAIGLRTLKYSKLNIAFNHNEVEPLYAYQFQPKHLINSQNYTISTISLNLKFAYKEKLVNSFNQRMSLGTKYPVCYISYTRGIKNVLKSQFNFNKLETRVEQTFLSRNLGKTSYQIDAGYINNALPMGLLFTGEGSNNRDIPIAIKNSFQTVRPYEFVSDKFINLHLSHNFGSLLFKYGQFKPHITIQNSISWGKLSNQEYHKDFDFKTKEKGLFETGIKLDNLLRFNYCNLAYIGLGAGVYYRYGPYARQNHEDNFSVKFSMTFSTK